ncbi:glycosyltransferase family 2 protein [Hyunsoonleella aestuarii]|uniref:Glycosyltransferase 2-like domain-containing protein n=1 Tax=Hyunsoonleella aestuarii TaxID=912802 RepID=A0ABP8E6W6_9FLAO|nr:glycosyltransferase family A protein [Hyunsoonleella aestuarii]
MLFRFIKYLQPTHYFQRYKNDGKSIFPIAENLPRNILMQLTHDTNYLSKQGQNYDLSWQAIQLGYIGEAKTYTSFDNLPLHDNYVFIRKYFNKVWVFYVFLMRIFSFRNIFKEFSAYFKTRHVNRINYLKQPLKYDSWKGFDSELLKLNPKISVIIPTLNRYEFLKDVLKDLERQDYKNFEVIIIDQTDAFQEHFYKSFNLNLIVDKQKEKALWLARNNGIRMSKGEYLLFFDDDSRVKKDWIKNHIECLDFFKADVSSGISISKKGAKVPENYSFFRISDQIDTGNVLIKKEVFKSIGLFDRQFEKQRMGDGEFGMRTYLNNYLNISNPFAERLHLKVSTGGLRQMGSWDGYRSKKWFAPRPIPSVLYYFRMYFGDKAARLALLRTIPLSVLPYQFKKNKPLLFLGGLLAILISPIIFIQVYRSWQLASKKIKEGPLIKKLD